ncbi:MAG TPA: sugar phosphate isomerase/epimerase [Aggregatilineales bacterium]|nr:sugar phosphate isomerase/epimerase [Aggregatilineales bacterium]
MQLGFVSAILPELSLEEVLKFASQNGFDCVEAMCWPVGKAERRYAGVTHVDVNNFSASDAQKVKALVAQYGVQISGLGYYPNPLAADEAEREVYSDHIKMVIAAARLLDIGVVNTFIGRDPSKTIEDNWPMFEKVWKPLIAFAESQKTKVGIENCPMLFSYDEWPGGKNLAISPEVWRRMFDTIPSPNLGLNFDPSHLIWQHIDTLRCIREFGNKFFHVHLKDEKILTDVLYDKGILGVKWHVPKLPGLGTVDWGAFFSALNDIQYDGAVCIEVEDRAYESSPEDCQRALRQSKRYLEPFLR